MQRVSVRQWAAAVSDTAGQKKGSENRFSPQRPHDGLEEGVALAGAWFAPQTQALDYAEEVEVAPLVLPCRAVPYVRGSVYVRVDMCVCVCV